MDTTFLDFFMHWNGNRKLIATCILCTQELSRPAEPFFNMTGFVFVFVFVLVDLYFEIETELPSQTFFNVAGLVLVFVFVFIFVNISFIRNQLNLFQCCRNRDLEPLSHAEQQREVKLKIFVWNFVSIVYLYY